MFPPKPVEVTNELEKRSFFEGQSILPKVDDCFARPHIVAHAQGQCLKASKGVRAACLDSLICQGPQQQQQACLL